MNGIRYRLAPLLHPAPEDVGALRSYYRRGSKYIPLGCPIDNIYARGIQDGYIYEREGAMAYLSFAQALAWLTDVDRVPSLVIAALRVRGNIIGHARNNM